jgi:hypothetical protein
MRSVSSSVAALLAFVTGGAHAAPVRFDFNSGASPTQAGWVALPEGNGTDGVITVATTPIAPATVGSRDRAAINTDGAGADIANNDMWRDFVFANGSTAANAGSGLTVTLSGLIPNATYPLRIWAFDESSNATAPSVGRSADWRTPTGSATLVFPTSPDPVSLDSDTVMLNGTADGNGMIVLTGIVSVVNPDVSHNVFINGLEIGNALLDADGDGMQDAYEQDIIDFDPNDAINTIQDVLPGDDFDRDDSNNAAEEIRGTSPVDPDTDDDTVLDGAEDGGGVWMGPLKRGTSPFVADSDKDGLSDAVERPDVPYNPADAVNQPGSDPNKVDTDGDQASDFREVSVDGTDPTNAADVIDLLAGAVALFDFNAPGSPVMAGWTGADLGSGSNGVVTVATAVIDAGAAVTLDSRDRDPLINTDDATADVANADLWRDFVFANGSFSAAPGSGLRVTLTGLLPLTSYPIRIWAFDESSNGGRRADWGVSGEAPAATLTFPDSPDPRSLFDYLVEFEALTDASGRVILDGLVAAASPSVSHNVFVNALMVGSPGGSALPVITGIVYDPIGGRATVTWTSRPGQVFAFDASGDLIIWSELSDNVDSQGESTSYTETGLTPANVQRYYRVRVLP